MFDAVPAEIKACPQWILWRKVWLPERNKYTKVPISPVTGRNAATDNPADWASFEQAYSVLSQYHQTHDLHGLGFVFGHASGIGGIDCDDVFTADGRVLDQGAVALAQRFASYTELSPSGLGLHTLIKAELPRGRRFRNIEVYGQGRYFTITGKPYGAPLPLAYRQAEADTLVSEIDAARAQAAPADLDFSVAPKITNEELWQIARSADNGEKFFRLWNGDISLYDNDHSRADFALIDILAFYTDSPWQVQTMFLASGLGQREKARTRPDYVRAMIARSFDRKIPLVPIPALPTPAVVETPVSMPVVDAEEIEQEAANPYTNPDGLVGEIASYVYWQATYPMPEAAIIAALGLMAGIVGRQFQRNGQGLNLYLMLLANTGSGKDAIGTGMSRLFDAICEPPFTLEAPTTATVNSGFPAARDFQGPSQLTGKGVLRLFDKSSSLSCVSMLTEFSQTMSSMADPRANQGMRDFLNVLLEFYTKSTRGARYTGSMNADKTKDIKPISSPAFSMVCEGTPERFYKALNESFVTDGTLSRFVIVERKTYTDHNPRAGEYQVVPTGLRDKLMGLCNMVLSLRTNQDQFVYVQATEDADAFSEKLRLYYRQRGIDDTAPVHRHLWMRAHQNIERIASIVAIGRHAASPVITVDDLKWADAIVKRQVVLIISKFRTGEYGEAVNQESSQRDVLVHLIDKWINGEIKQFHRPAYRDARLAGLIPYSWLSQNCLSLAAFRKEKSPSIAFKNTVELLRNQGVLEPVKFGDNVGQFYRIHT